MDPNECLFCRIARGEMPSKKVYEDGDVIAFLDINPANPGHTLVVPKSHSETIFDIPDSDLEKVASVAKEIAARLREQLNVSDINLLHNTGKVAGQLVEHFHVHVIPRHEDDGFILKLPRNQATEEEMDEVVRKLGGSAESEKPAKEPEKKSSGKEEENEKKEENKGKEEKKEKKPEKKRPKDLDFELDF